MKCSTLLLFMWWGIVMDSMLKGAFGQQFPKIHLPLFSPPKTPLSPVFHSSPVLPAPLQNSPPQDTETFPMLPVSSKDTQLPFISDYRGEPIDVKDKDTKNPFTKSGDYPIESPTFLPFDPHFDFQPPKSFGRTPLIQMPLNPKKTPIGIDQATRVIPLLPKESQMLPQSLVNRPEFVPPLPTSIEPETDQLPQMGEPSQILRYPLKNRIHQPPFMFPLQMSEKPRFEQNPFISIESLHFSPPKHTFIQPFYPRENEYLGPAIPITQEIQPILPIAPREGFYRRFPLESISKFKPHTDRPVEEVFFKLVNHPIDIRLSQPPPWLRKPSSFLPNPAIPRGHTFIPPRRFHMRLETYQRGPMFEPVSARPHEIPFLPPPVPQSAHILHPTPVVFELHRHRFSPRDFLPGFTHPQITRFFLPPLLQEPTPFTMQPAMQPPTFVHHRPPLPELPFSPLLPLIPIPSFPMNEGNADIMVEQQHIPDGIFY